MIEYLEQLVEEKKYSEALKLAEQLIDTAQTPQDIVRISAARVVCHCRLSEYREALAGGDHAIELASEIGDWDSYGTIVLFIGVAYALLEQYQAAAKRMYDYLANFHRYGVAASLEYNAWYNLGAIQVILGEPEKAARSLANSLRAALRRGEHRYAHGVRQSLIDANLRAGLYLDIPRLLAQCGSYLRKHLDLPMHAMSWANYMQLRSEYALAQGRLGRARALATRALLKVQGEPAHEYLFHVVLAKVAQRRGHLEEALAHGLAGRICAVVSRRPIWERVADDLLYRIVQGNDSGTEAVDCGRVGSVLP